MQIAVPTSNEFVYTPNSKMGFAPHTPKIKIERNIKL